MPEPVDSRLLELTRSHHLPSLAADRFMAYLDVLSRDPHAPTAIRDPQAVISDHFADSLVALDLEFVRTAQAIADLGAGAGLPGLALAIALPHARVELVESNARKAAFLEQAVRACGASNAAIVRARAEEWTDGLEHCDVVTARALAPLPVVTEYAAPLLRIDGWAVAWRGRRDPAGEAAAARASAELGLEVAEPLRVTPYPDAAERHLHVFHKVRATPARFPRRPGIARKRPLGSPGIPRRV